MEIRCPECGYSRVVDAKSVDSDLTVAVCPKCNSKFSFRFVEESDADFSLQPSDDAPAAANKQQDVVSQDVKNETSADKIQENAQRPVRPEDLYPPVIHPDNSEDADKSASTSDRASEEDSSKLKMVYTDGIPLEEHSSDMPKDVPWAEVKELGFFTAIRATIQGVLKKPSLFFEIMDKKGKFSIPFSFFILTSLISVLFETVWQSTFGNPLFPSESVGSLSFDDLLSVLFVSPIILIVYLVMTGTILHGVLKLMGSGSRGVGVTLRVLCYAAAADLFSVIPIVGPIVGGVWKLVVIIIGLKTAHNSTYTRVIPPVAVLVLALVSFVLYSLKSQGIM